MLGRRFAGTKTFPNSAADRFVALASCLCDGYSPFGGLERGYSSQRVMACSLPQCNYLCAPFLIIEREVTYEEVLAMRVYEILQTKGNKVFQILPSATLAHAIERLVHHNCGSLMVAEAETIVGIITERDILKAINIQAHRIDSLMVCDFMTRKLITGHPSDEVGDVMGMMTSHRVRHLPIFDQGRLVGMVSIGDVVKAQFDLMAVENHYLKVYIQG